ncbi:MAG: DUF5372 family protein [Vicinamibacteria bacterium]
MATTAGAPWRSVCNSIQNAGYAAATTHLVRVTHPFHPLSGRQLVCLGERYNRYGTRLLLRVDDKTVCSVPRQWTDLVVPDPELVIGEERALFRIADLVELARLVARLGRRDSAERPDEV